MKMQLSSILAFFGVLTVIVLVQPGCHSGHLAEEELLTPLPEQVDFNFHIKPILSDRCFKCHGPDEKARKAELRLDLKESALNKVLQDGGHAFVPRKPHKSKAFQRITSTDPDLVMPPPDAKLDLSEREIALIEKWIRQGAEYKSHWAFIPPAMPVLPTVKAESWVRNPIDQFVLARLEAQNLEPNKPARKELLLRRLYFDLIGLPPTIGQLDSFLDDNTPQAYERVIEQLLQSPHFGERMALQWLDVARYADSHGYSQDGYRSMYPWRDWVIRAFNTNMPFDQFIKWQIAGDQLPEASAEQKLATAFLRNHRINGEGGIIPEEYRVEYVADRSHTTATAFLGLTMECARCHDHKYDPLSQEEYYQFFSFFNQVNEEGLGRVDGNSGPEIYLPDKAIAEQVAFLDRKIREQERRLDQREKDLLDQNPIQVPAPDLSEGLVVHLDFEDGFVNKTVNGKPQLTVRDKAAPLQYKTSGEPEIIPGPRGKVIKCGSYDMVIIEADLVNFCRADPFSFSFWVQARPETEFMEILHRIQNKYKRQNGYDISLKNGHLTFRLAHSLPANLIEVQTAQVLPESEWTHVTLTYDGSSRAAGVEIYLNGEKAEKRIVFDQLQKFVTHPGVLTIGGKMHLEENVDHGYLLVDDLRIYKKALTGLEVAGIFGAPAGENASRNQIAHYLRRKDGPYRQLLDSIRHYRVQRNRHEDQFLGVMVMEDHPEPRPTFVLERGVYDARGKEVSAGTPQAVLPFPEAWPKNRLGLARWLTSPKNPLTSRVIVNRLWQQFFGRGLVGTPEDFGSQGELPSHPELLDWLAVQFIETGWDLKGLIKTILLSATYRQSSVVSLETRQADPENRLLARGPSHRLPAELIRDNALAVSGLLVDSIGGPSVKPYQPPGLWSEKSFFSEVLRKYVPDHGDKLYRRSLYTFWRRTNHHPVMSVLDAPTRDNCSVRRQATNTPLQALAMMNETQFVEAARMLAERVIRTESGIEDQIALAYRLLTSCRADTELVSLLVKLWEKEHRRFESHPDQALQLLAVGEHPRDLSLNANEHAALTVVCNTMLNLDEVITKR